MCIALGWRFVDWPLPIAATRTTTRSKNRTRGVQGPEKSSRREQGPGIIQWIEGPQPFSLERQVRKYRVQSSPPPLPPPPLSGQPGQEPTTPLHRATPSPRKLSSRIDLGENLVLASKSGSEIMVRAQDDQMKHFWLNGISLRGQIAELETSAGWPARFSIALLCEDQAGRYNQG